MIRLYFIWPDTWINTAAWCRLANCASALQKVSFSVIGTASFKLFKFEWPRLFSKVYQIASLFFTGHHHHLSLLKIISTLMMQILSLIYSKAISKELQKHQLKWTNDLNASQMLRWWVSQDSAPSWHWRWWSLLHKPWGIWLWFQNHNYIPSFLNWHFFLVFFTITLIAAAAADAMTDIFLRHTTEIFFLLNKHDSSLAIGYHR